MRLSNGSVETPLRPQLGASFRVKLSSIFGSQVLAPLLYFLGISLFFMFQTHFLM